jgi:hypothetical protein
MGAAIFVVLYVLVIFVYDAATLPGQIAAQTVSPPFIAEDVAYAPSSITLPLAPLSASGQGGTATFRAVEGKTIVRIELRGAPPTAQPAHIHAGQCPGVGEVRYQLGSVVNGISETTLSVPLTKVLSEFPVAVNVHASSRDVATYVACGAIADR